MKYISKLVDLTGQTFGRLKVIERVKNNKNGKARWLCECECGKKVIVYSTNLVRNITLSCGCLSKEMLINRNKRFNTYEIFEDYVVFYTNNNEPFYVDLDDFEKVKRVCWWKTSRGYLQGLLNGRRILLHRYIMNCPDDMVVDHINGTETIHDNRKSNLRIVTTQQNSMNHKVNINNKSGVTGVSWDECKRKWNSQIGVNGETIHLGLYDDIQDAINARKRAENKYFGEYSRNKSNPLSLKGE